MPKTKSPKRGRPVADDPLVHNKGVRLTEADYLNFQAEAERRSKVTGIDWTIADYLRFAGRECLGGPIGGDK